jgi:hypothetical protein
MFLSYILAALAFLIHRMPPDQAPKYVRGHTITLCFVIASWLLVAANVYVRKRFGLRPNSHYVQFILPVGKQGAP